MTNLSQHAGGGSVSELFLARDYGGTGQCDVQNLGYAGGKIEFFMQAKFEPDTGASDSRVWSWLSSSGSYWNLLVQVYDSDHATVERRNKMRVLMQNNTGTAIIDLLSNIEVADSNLHYIFFTGDPATGNFEYTINGNDADDTTYSNRSATSGTMETGANDDLGFMGYVNTTNNRVKGSVAYVGLRFDHATAGTYSDVFNEVGGVTLDLGGFAQPQWDWFSNVGQPNVNWGTNTAMTFTGSATDLWVRRVDNLGLGIDTVGTGTAEDQRSGTISWVDGVQVTGAAPDILTQASQFNSDVQALMDSLVFYFSGNEEDLGYFPTRAQGSRWVSPTSITGTAIQGNFLGGHKELNGTQYYYWDGASELAWDGTQAFTVVFTLNQNVSANDPIIGIGAATNHATDGWLVMRNLTTDVYFQINAAPGYPTDELQCYATNGTSGTWETWAVSYDGSKSDTGVTFYRDGISETTIAGANNLSGDATPDSANRLYIAGDIGGSTLQGKVAHLHVFNRELTASEMAAVTSNIMVPYTGMARVFG